MPPIIVFCAFTRLELMDRWFDDLASTDLDPETTSLAFTIDCNEEQGGPKIYAKIMAEMNRTKFRKFVIMRNYDHRVNEVNIPIRRQRIAFIKNQSKHLIRALPRSEFVLSLEDDSVFTNLSVKRLYDIAKEPEIGFCTAFQAGRWHKKIIGVWGFDDVEHPTECWTMLPGEGYKPCDAAGYYCYLTRTDVYMAAENYTLTSQPWGPDVNFGLWCRQVGLTNIVDWSQPIGHYDLGDTRDKDVIITPNGDLAVEHFVKSEAVGIDHLVWQRMKEQVA